MLLAFLFGALATAAFAPLYLVPVLLVAFPAFILLTEASGGLWGAFAIGWMFGFGHFLTGFYWVGNALEIAGAPPAAALALPLGMALYPGVAAVLYKLVRRRVPSRVLLFAVCWGLGEWLRGHVITGFPWNLAAYAWAFSDSMSQFASVCGAYGLTLITAALAATPVALLDRPLRRPADWWPAGVAVAAIAGIFAFGAVRLATAPAEPPGQPMVRLVQPDIAQDEKWLPQNYDRNFTEHLALSRRPGADRIDLFAWSEAAVPYQLDQDAARRAQIAALVKPGGVVVTGFPRVAEDADGRVHYYNSMIFIGSDGRTLALFDKFHLVPFGEYVPLKGVFRALDSVFEALGLGLRFQKVVEGGGDFVPGVGPRVIHLPNLPPVSPLVCYEVIFPGAVTPPGERPAWLLNITNDAWYGEWAGPHQHFAIARFRAIEEGLPMVRAAGTGVSAIIDAHGRVLQRLGLGQRGVVDGPLPAPLPPTLYARFGDHIFWVMMALAAALALGTRARRRP
ncbi:MAG: apolipoprotein N-acyltransferase [Alphaproteobacteria bacterium]|nr:apolipoprotein N-acyltransferase [Alphaproteobacteria bacterium]